MRIVHVLATLAPGLGGPSAVAPEMAAALAARGHDVRLITTDYGAAVRNASVRTVDRDGYQTWTYPARSIGPYAFSWPMAWDLRRHIARADVVHVHSLYLLHSAVAGAVARHRHVPYVVRPHGTLTRYQRSRHRLRKSLYELAIERRNLRCSAAVHYTSQREADEALAAGYPGRPVVIPLGVTIPAAAASPASSNTVLFLGRLAEKKGLEILVAAFARIITAHPQARLVIAGPDGGVERATRALVQRLGISDRVSFPGFISADRKWELLRDARVFVLPSADENFGMAPVEALAAGVPVIVSEHVAIATEVQAEGGGIVVSRDVAALASVLRELLESPERAATLGAQGRRLAQTRFSWPVVADSLEHLYAETLMRSEVKSSKRPAAETL